MQRVKAASHPEATGAPGSGTAWPRPRRPSLPAGWLYIVQRLLAPNPVYRRAAAWLERSPRLYALFTRAEQQVKEKAFDCRMCGQCALPATGYSCPMTCPKQLRNGPCGGVGADGGCEVYPEMRCVWVTAFERAQSQGRADDLRLLQRPIDQRLWGQSSWVNYWQGRDGRLWTGDDGLQTAPGLLPAGAGSAT